MSQQYYSLLTIIGAAKLAAATANQSTINLTQIAVGDGNGLDTTPNVSDTILVNEVYRTNINELKVDENNSNYILVSSIIPPEDGNFWVREIGLFDEDGDLIAIGNKSATFKPVLSDGEANELLLKIAIEVTNSDTVELVIDPSIVMASQEFVNLALEGKSNTNHNHDSTYAKLGGLATQLFKVKNAVADNEAVSKLQMENAISNINIYGVGIGQTWQDVTSSKNLNVTYTNNTGKPIAVSVSASLYSTENVSITVGTELFLNQQAGANYTTEISRIVPMGETYKFGSSRAGNLLIRELK